MVSATRRTAPSPREVGTGVLEVEKTIGCVESVTARNWTRTQLEEEAKEYAAMAEDDARELDQMLYRRKSREKKEEKHDSQVHQ